MSSVDPIVGYAFVVADLLHYGHLHFLRECKKYCEYLIVGVYTDELTQTYKRVPIIPFKERYELIKALRIVDKVVKVTNRNCTSMMKKLVHEGYNLKILFHGSDWNANKDPDLKKSKEFIESIGGKLIQPKYYEGCSTTSIIKNIIERPIITRLVWENYDDDFPRCGKKRNYEINREIARRVAHIGGTVLDVGCASGITYECIKKTGVNYIGIDFTRKFLDRGKELNPEFKCIVASAYNVPFSDKYFDTVFCKSLLEHQHPNNYFKIVLEMERVAKKQILIAFFKPPHDSKPVITIYSGAYSNRYNKPTFIRLLKTLKRYKNHHILENVCLPEEGGGFKEMTLYIITLKQ